MPPPHNGEGRLVTRDLSKCTVSRAETGLECLPTCDLLMKKVSSCLRKTLTAFWLSRSSAKGLGFDDSRCALNCSCWSSTVPAPGPLARMNLVTSSLAIPGWCRHLHDTCEEVRALRTSDPTTRVIAGDAGHCTTLPPGAMQPDERSHTAGMMFDIIGTVSS